MARMRREIERTWPTGPRTMVLTAGRYAAEVTTTGAGLLSLTWSGHDLVSRGTTEPVDPYYVGRVLAPWPNRIRDGRYRWRCSDLALPVNDAATGCALHGLVFDQPWQVHRAEADRVDLVHHLDPQPGYPFAVVFRVRYRLSDRGLAISVAALNVGSLPAPYGSGLHPYLTSGFGPIDGCCVRLPAATVCDRDERGFALGARLVDSAGLDFRHGAVVGERRLDHAFTDLLTDDGRWWRAVVQRPGADWSVSIESDSRWVHVYTADGPMQRSGLALEPMSCPPDAFGTGRDLIVLEPGGSHTLRARITGGAGA